MKKIKPTELFSIDLKVSGQVRSIPVYANDTHESLVKRFCSHHFIQQQYQQLVQQKIIQSLLLLLKNTSLAPTLKQKVEKFVGKTKQNKSKARSIQKQEPPSVEIESISAVNCLPERRKLLNRQIDNELAKNSPVKRKIENREIKPKTRSVINKSYNTIDNDLLQAYETIYKKSKQNEMKGMAKKCLEECGYFEKENPVYREPILCQKSETLVPAQPIERIRQTTEGSSGKKAYQRHNYNLDGYREKTLLCSNRYNTENRYLPERPTPSRSYQKLQSPPTIMNKLYEESYCFAEPTRVMREKKYRYLFE